MRLVLCLSLVALIFSGCETPEQRQKQRQRSQQWETNYNADVAKYVTRTGTSDRVASNVRGKSLFIGMSRNSVYYALRLTGREDNNTLKTTRLSPGGRNGPIEVNRTVTASGTYDQWVMPDGFSGPKYIYIDDGILTSWQS
jgi:hypothetical protein